MKKFSDFCTCTMAMGTWVGAFTNTNKKKYKSQLTGHIVHLKREWKSPSGRDLSVVTYGG